MNVFFCADLSTPFPDNYERLMLTVEGIMLRAIGQGAKKLVFGNRCWFERHMLNRFRATMSDYNVIAEKGSIEEMAPSYHIVFVGDVSDGFYYELLKNKSHIWLNACTLEETWQKSH